MDRKRLIGFTVLLFTLVAFIFVVYHLRGVFAPFFLAYILQFILRPFVNMLESRGVSHPHAVIIVFAGTFLSIAVVLSIVIPAFISEIANVQDNIDEYAQVVNTKVEEIKTLFTNSSIINKFTEDNPSLLVEIRNYLKDSFMLFLQRVTKNIFSFISLILLVSVIPFATFFFLYDGYNIKKRIVALVPNKYFEITLNIMHRLNVQFGLILQGMLASVCIITLLSSVLLWAIKLEYPVIVGIFAGFSNLIPYFGPVAGTIVAFIVAFVTGAPPIFFLYIILVFIVVNLIDNTLVQPIVLSRAANIHPLLIIFLVITGSKIAGILGMLFIVPMVSLVMVVLNIIYREIKRPVRPDLNSFIDIP